MTTARPSSATTPEVARLIGATTRQVQHWSNQGWLRVTPHPGAGTRSRDWTPDAIRHAAIVAQLVTTLGADPAVASTVADLAISNTGRSWSTSLDHLLVVGDLPWVPEPPDDTP